MTTPRNTLNQLRGVQSGRFSGFDYTARYLYSAERDNYNWIIIRADPKLKHMKPEFRRRWQVKLYEQLNPHLFGD